MITTVTLNPCIDHTIMIDALTHGGLNKVQKSRKDFGGKGINVSKAVKNLGLETQASTLGFSKSVKLQKECLEESGIKTLLMQVDGKLRTNVKVFENENGLMTEFNEKGSFVTEYTVKAIEREVVGFARKTEIIVFGGSLCLGIPSCFYNTLIKKCKEESPNIKIILDASGVPFVDGIKAVPYAIKPNIFELEEAFGIKLGSVDDILSIAREIVALGVEIVCVSMGKDGAIAVSKDKAYIAMPPKIEVKSVLGAGDSMVAGLCFAILEGKPLDIVLKYTMAMASATVLREGTLMGLKSEFEKFLEQIQVTGL